MLLPGTRNVLHRGPIGTDLLLELLTLAGLVALSVWMQSVLPHEEDASWTAFLPGAIVLAVGADLLRIVTQVYLAGRLGRVDDLYGALGVAAVFMAWPLPRRATDRRLRRRERRTMALFGDRACGRRD